MNKKISIEQVPHIQNEDLLIELAEKSESDEIANAAMKKLREKFDPTYIWCMDCDGIVIKERDCCNNFSLDIETASKFE